MRRVPAASLTTALLTLGFTAWTGPAWAQEGKVWAVVVGIDQYVHNTIPSLRYAVADAKLFAQALQDVVKVPKENVFLLTSDSPDEQAQPKLTNVVYRLGWLKEKVKPDDTLIFYFAGHGLTMEGDSYLLTEEADNRNAATLKFSALRGNDLTELLKMAKVKKAMVMMDACRNSPTKLEWSYPALGAGTGSSQSATMFSCNVGQKSWEWDDKKHGIFTYFLVEGLRQQAADAKGQVTLQGLTEYVNGQVSATAKKLVSADQTPILRYEGPGPSSWLLATVAGLPPVASNPGKRDADTSKFVAELEAARAQVDAEVAARKAAESRAKAEESRRRELEERLALMEKKTPPGAPDPRVAQLQADLATAQALVAKYQGGGLVAYADRGAPGIPDSQRAAALEAEVGRLKAENQALKARLSAMEGQVKSVSLTAAPASSREVKLMEDDWQTAVAKEARLRSQVELAMSQGLPKENVAQAQMGLEQAVRQSLSAHLAVIEVTYGAAMAARPLEPKLKEEVEFLTSQVEAQRQATLTFVAKAGAADSALQEARNRLAEAEARIAKYEAIIKDLTSKLQEAEKKLATLEASYKEAEAKRQAATERANAAEGKLMAMENLLEDKYKGKPFARDMIRSTRRIRLSDLAGTVKTDPDATELPAPK